MGFKSKNQLSKNKYLENGGETMGLVSVDLVGFHEAVPTDTE